MRKVYRQSRKQMIIWVAVLYVITGTGWTFGAALEETPKGKNRNPQNGLQSTVTESIETQRLELDRQKLAEEEAEAKERLRIEWAKLDYEKSSAWRSSWSSIVPLLAAFLTLGYSVWSFRKQTRQQSELQLQAAKLQFDIKAAEIAFSGKTPEAVGNRAAALRAVFADRLPREFANSFEPKQYGGGRESPDEKKFFMELLLKYPEQQQDVFKLWTALFNDEWLKRAEPLIRANQKTQSPFE